MVDLATVRSSNTRLVSTQPLVVVVVGVAGIGGYALRALAATHGKDGKGLRVYIVARTAAKVEALILDCQKLCPAGHFHFVQANDLALLQEVDKTCVELIKVEEKQARAAGDKARIDILIMAHANFEPWHPRQETSEGLDTFMSLLYYSRMRFTLSLLPLLLASSLPAHVISVYGPGRDATLIADDLSLRDPKNYGFMSSGSHAAYLTTFFMEHLAAQHPGHLALTHYYPGLVFTDAIFSPRLPAWFRGFFYYARPLLLYFLPMALTAEECGDRVLFNASSRFPCRLSDGEAMPSKTDEGVDVAASSDGIDGGGAYRVNWNGEVVNTGKQYPKLREEGWLEKVVRHTMEAFEEIKAGRVFTG